METSLPENPLGGFLSLRRIMRRRQWQSPESHSQRHVLWAANEGHLNDQDAVEAGFALVILGIIPNVNRCSKAAQNSPRRGFAAISGNIGQGTHVHHCSSHYDIFSVVCGSRRLPSSQGSLQVQVESFNGQCEDAYIMREYSQVCGRAPRSLELITCLHALIRRASSHGLSPEKIELQVKTLSPV